MVENVFMANVQRITSIIGSWPNQEHYLRTLRPFQIDDEIIMNYISLTDYKV